jgi:Transglycosylase SLT domain
MNLTQWIITAAGVILATLNFAPKKNEKDLDKFLTDMAQIESEGKPHVVNRFGYMGLYQFHPATIRSLGFKISRKKFLNDPELQDTVMVAYLRANRQELARYIDRYEGKKIRGVTITESGILAGAHLVGSAGVMAFFNPTKFKYRTVDGNGTSVQFYMKKFADYDLELD